MSGIENLRKYIKELHDATIKYWFDYSMGDKLDPMYACGFSHGVEWEASRNSRDTIERNDSAAGQAEKVSLPSTGIQHTNNAIALLCDQLMLPPDARDWNVICRVKNMLCAVVAQQH